MEKVAWIDLEKAVLSDNRLSFSQKRNLIANFYDGIFFSEAGYSPKEYLEAFQTRDDYEERDVGGIIQGQNKARKAASRSPIERLKLPPLLKKLPQGFLEQAQSTMEKGMSDLSVNDDQVGKLTKERFLEQTIGGLDEQAQQEVSAQLIASDPFYGQAFDNIQQRRAERGEEQLSISPQSTFTPVLDVSLSQ